MMRGVLICAAAVVLAIGLSAPAMAQRYDRGGRNDVNHLEGLSVRSAQDTLRYGGFNPARSIKRDGRQWDLWSSGRDCVGFTSYNGTVTNSERFDDRACAYGDTSWGRDGGWNDGRGWNDRDGRGWNDRRGGRFDVRDIVGLRVDDGKRQLSYSGYQGARSISLRGQRWDLWRGRDACVGFTSYYGQITDAQRFPDEQCWR